MSPRAACRLEALGFTRVYDYVDGIADWTAAGLSTDGTKQQPLRVVDAVRADIPTCQPDTPLQEVRTRLRDTEWDVCVVIDCDGGVVGRLRETALEIGDHRPAEEGMEPGPGTLRPDSLLEPLVKRLTQQDISHALVTTAQGELMGVVVRDEARRLLAGDSPEQIWQDCECCPGRWTTVT